MCVLCGLVATNPCGCRYTGRHHNSKETMMIRVAMLSFWHVHARDYLKQALEHPDTEIVAVWDEDPERGRAQAASLGVRFYEKLDELLAQPDIDAVIVDTPTNLH